MSENKFLAKMRSEKAPKSLVEVKNDKFLTPFVGLPKSTNVSHGFQNDAESSVIVANAAKNWGLQKTGLGLLEDASNAVYTGGVNVAGQNAWINLSYTFPTSSDSTNSVVSIINPSSKWVLRLVGKDLFSQNENIGFELVVKIGSTNIANIECATTRQAGFFCKTFVVDFSDSADKLIKVNGGDKLTVQLFCKDKTATACYYTGSSVLSLLERRIDADAVANEKISFEDIIDGLKTKQDIATAVNYDNIANCITEIPQNIQIQTSGETCTLKAGSKVYIPNGAGVFNVITISADISNSAAATDSFVVTNGNILVWTNNVFSGTTAPSAPANSTLWYDTANNLVKRFSTSSGSWVSGFSLPIALFNSQDNSKTKIFNGFGYIGSTIFVLPGVKGLVPNGRNADGTLKNNERTVSSVLTYTSTYWNNDVELYIGANSIFVSRSVTYDEPNNILSATNVFYAGKTNLTSDFAVKSLTPKTPFRAVDYNDTDFIAHQAMPSDKYVDLTLPASGGTITAPANGYLSFAKAGQTTEYVSLINYKNGISITSSPSVNGNNARLFMPVSKGDVINLAYTASGTITYFRFVYSNGAK